MQTASVLVTETAYGWIAICEDLPSLCGTGDDGEEALADLHCAISAHMRAITIH